MISVLGVIEITQFRFKFPRAEMRLALQSNLEPLNDTLYVGPVSVFFVGTCPGQNNYSFAI